MKAKASNAKPKRVASARRPHNRYNIWFILERENIILSKGGSTKWSSLTPLTWSIQKDNESLNLPPLPSRFRHLKIPADWCVADSTKKRPHRKTHGVVTFRDLVKAIATGWKTIDEETMNFCSTVEKVLKQRHLKLQEEAKSANTDDKSKQPNEHNHPKQVKPKQARLEQVKPQQVKPEQVKSLQVKLLQVKSNKTRIAAVSPTGRETLPDVPTRLDTEGLFGETVSLSLDPTAPGIIKNFSGEVLSSSCATITSEMTEALIVKEEGDLPCDTSECTGMLGDTISDSQVDTFSSLAESIHAPIITNQSDPHFGPNNWAIMDDIHPSCIDSKIDAIAPADNLSDVEISDDDIMKMWHSEH